MENKSTKKRSTIKRSTSPKSSSKGKKPTKNAPQKKNANPEVRRICLLFIAAVLLFSHMGVFGALGGFLRRLCKLFCGSMSLAVPLILLTASIHLFVKKTLSPHKYRYVFTALFFVCLCGIHTLYSANVHAGLFNGSFEDVINDITASSDANSSGGLIGAIIALPLKALVSSVGTYLILILLASVCFVTVTGTEPFTRAFSYLYKNISEFLFNIKEEKDADREAEDLIKINGIEDEDSSKKKKRKSEGEEPAKKKKKKTGKEILTGDEIAALGSDNDEFAINLYDDKKSKGEEKSFEKAEIPDEIKKAAMEASGGVEEIKEDTSPIAVTEDEIELEYIPYTFPPIDLLSKAKAGGSADKPEDLRTQAKKLVDTLASFGVEAKVLEVSKGPAVTRFELQPSAGVKVSKIVNLADDIALNLAAFGVRIEAPIPGKAAVGIEIPNKSTSMVALREVIDSHEFRTFKSKTAFAMGKDIAGQAVVSDISKMPHMLIAGATGSGKSVCINSLITSILYKADPNEVKLILIDPKVVELGVYNGIPHLLIPVVTDPRRAAGALNWAVQEMVKRYSMFATANVRDIKGYNEYAALNGERLMEQIIIVIDELADLMMVSPHEVEDSICRLAQMARAAGMHLVIATQRPSVDVITGLIKANVPSRIAFSVSSQIDSRTILDMGGAEKLLGKGDMLFLPMGASKPKRLQGAFVSDKEIEKIVEFVKNCSSAHYNEDIIEHIENGADDHGSSDDSEADDLLPQAIEIVVELGQASASLLQRKLKVGYSRAGRLIDQLEERGIIGPHEGSKPRKVLISRSEFQEMMVNQE
ncbi:MAG: DNA translocase FtsK 4TM domain-containing protein [Clostridia bacterium]|nr:DNA translocase FtsK 4TM domain-containing protein [Clostridia bacterium]